MGTIEMNAKWHVVLTRPGFEAKVAAQLDKKNITNYCPFQPAGAETEQGKKLVMVPVFKSYVFVRISEQEAELVSKTKGVLNFAYWMNMKAVIHEQDIETIRTFLGDYYNAQVEPIPVDQQERGIVTEESISSANEILHKVKATLPSLGFKLVTDAVKPKMDKVKIIHRSGRPSESIFNRLPSMLRADRLYKE